MSSLNELLFYFKRKISRKKKNIILLEGFCHNTLLERHELSGQCTKLGQSYKLFLQFPFPHLIGLKEGHIIWIISFMVNSRIIRAFNSHIS